jgi:hypothetical protein
MALGLALSFATPSFAAPDPGKGWKLTGQKKVRYFVGDRSAGTTTSRDPVTTKLVSSETEATPRTTVRESAKADVYDTVAPAKEELISSKLRRGFDNRKVTVYEDKAYETPEYRKTWQRYRLTDVSTWKERTKNTLSSTYKDTTTVSWQDPFTSENHTTQSSTIVGPLTEYAYGAWTAKSASKGAGETSTLLKEHPRKVLSSRNSSKALASYASGGAAAPATTALSLNPFAEVAYSEGPSSGSSAGRSSNLASSLHLAGATQARSKGAKDTASQLATLIEAAKAGKSLYLNGHLAFRLAFANDTVVFQPADSSGALQPLAVALNSRSLEADNGGIEIKIKGVGSAANGGVTLVGKFRSAYLGKKEGKGDLLTTL